MLWNWKLEFDLEIPRVYEIWTYLDFLTLLHFLYMRPRFWIVWKKILRLCNFESLSFKVVQIWLSWGSPFFSLLIDFWPFLGLLFRKKMYFLGNVQDFHSHKYSPPGVSSSGGVIPSPINGLHTPVGISGHSRHIGSGHKRKDTKTTRVRTVLNEKQLHTLRSCYAANCRPDALMKEQLTEITGLSARVIRVWFQNKRCKDKKRSIALKQLQEQQAKQQKIGEQVFFWCNCWVKCLWSGNFYFNFTTCKF